MSTSIRTSISISTTKRTPSNTAEREVMKSGPIGHQPEDDDGDDDGDGDGEEELGE